MTNDQFRNIVSERILILDGAMGSLIQEYHLEEQDFTRGLENFGIQLSSLPPMKGNNDVLNLTRPDVVSDIHEQYLKAGADIITTNTFNAQRISQSDYCLGSLAKALNEYGARIARTIADRYSTPQKPRFVAGSIGPTNQTCSLSPDVNDPAHRALSYDLLFNAYDEQVEGLILGGADVLLVETIFDSLNAKVAVAAALNAMDRLGISLPIMLSVTVSDAAGRTLSGQTLDAFLASISTFPVFSVGLNCSFGARQMKPYLEHLAAVAPYYISAYPNAGLPNELGLYDETPQSMAPQIAQFIEERLVNIVGGCCGTTPDFIAQYVPLVEGRQPHVPVARTGSLWLSGLELLDIPGSAMTFVKVGERCNVAGSRKFLRLIKEKNYDEALEIARKQVADGAAVIDINMDDGLLDAVAEMEHFLRLIAAEPEIARVPVMIDSSSWPVILAGLKNVQGKSIVNSISLKEGEDVFLDHARAVRRLGAAVVVMCFDEVGQATTYERRIEIAQRSYRLLTEQAGFQPSDIIIDPNILAIATGMKEHDTLALDFIRATSWIRQHLPGVHISGGVSNLSFSFRGNNFLREAMHAVFLRHAQHAGMDFGIVNPVTKVTYESLPQPQLQLLEDVILCRRDDASECLMEQIDLFASDSVVGKSETVNPVADSEESVETRLAKALIAGNGSGLHDDLQEALRKFPRAVDIITGPLMDGMREVGRRFAQGQMFLPQVVKTARTMKQAVEILQPYIGQQAARRTPDNAQDVSQKHLPKILLATVKGDVHDIGKNIVGVIMACNGYEVIDLGVMVPAEEIVRRVGEEQVDMIGLSGLITPSLEEMVNVARELRRHGIQTPIMIGGATTSQLHVALKIAPVYEGPVVWMKDASQNPIVARQLLEDPGRLKAALDDEYDRMRQDYLEEQQLVTLEEARRNRLHLFDQ